MNKLLRNPWVVAALVIGMAALWWVQMRSIIYPGGVANDEPPAVVVNETSESSATDLGADAMASAEPASAPVDESAIVPFSDHPLSPTQLRWAGAPGRDPFGPVALNTPHVSSEPTLLTQAAPVTDVVEAAPVLPTLEAVLNTPSAHIAVIDGRMVRVGDKVSGRPVLKIDTASVALGRGADTAEPLLLRLPSR